MTRWYPLEASLRFEAPEPGQLVALRHGVWLVERVEHAEWTDADREAWLADGMPDEAAWRRAPVVLHVRHVGGAKPVVLGERDTGSITVHAIDHAAWHVYQGTRWPSCSCCGEPMPCRAEMEDRDVTAGLERVAELEGVLPGCCWSCREAVSFRQESVAYDGPNLLLPGREPPVFHLRRRCRPDAEAYERRRLAEDPRRERVLTYPRCRGILVVHADGSSECVAGPTPLGGDAETQPDCPGAFHPRPRRGPRLLRRRGLLGAVDDAGLPPRLPARGAPGRGSGAPAATPRAVRCRRAAPGTVGGVARPTPRRRERMTRRWAALALLLALVALSLLFDPPRGHVPPGAVAVVVVAPLAVAAVAAARHRAVTAHRVAEPASRAAVAVNLAMTAYASVRARHRIGQEARALARLRRAPSPA